MNTSATSQQGNEQSASGFTYGLGVSIGIVALITTITLASYFCTRDNDQSSRSDDNQHHVIEVGGIDEAILKSYPKCIYSKLDKRRSSTQNNCSVCLVDYKGKDQVRELVECGHVFHVKCVDPWLRLHLSCPLCRTSPLPTPQSTPLGSNLRAS